MKKIGAKFGFSSCIRLGPVGTDFFGFLCFVGWHSALEKFFVKEDTPGDEQYWCEIWFF